MICPHSCSLLPSAQRTMLVYHLVNSLTHRERRCAAPARRATEDGGGHSWVIRREKKEGPPCCCDKGPPGCVGRARRLPASPRVSLVSRRNPSGDRPPAAALECQGICETVHQVPEEGIQNRPSVLGP